jgi:hypothetical protein
MITVPRRGVRYRRLALLSMEKGPVGVLSMLAIISLGLRVGEKAALDNPVSGKRCRVEAKGLVNRLILSPRRKCAVV